MSGTYNFAPFSAEEGEYDPSDEVAEPELADEEADRYYASLEKQYDA